MLGKHINVNTSVFIVRLIARYIIMVPIKIYNFCHGLFVSSNGTSHNDMYFSYVIFCRQSSSFSRRENEVKRFCVNMDVNKYTFVSVDQCLAVYWLVD